MGRIKAFIHRDKYRIFLFSIAALLFLEPLVPDPVISYYISLVLFTLILITGVYAVRGKRRHLIHSLVLLLPTLVLFWLQVPTDNEFYIIIARTSPVLLFSYISVLIFMDVLTTRQVNADMIAGGVSVYLMMGLIFGLIYQAHFLLDPGTFSVSESLEVANVDETNTLYLFTYFSFVTMTTLGYGDISPLALHTRNLVQIETLAGQMYVAIFIARLVSIQTANRMMEED